MAGGEGTRLQPLTAERSKPSVPFAGRYRIVDFVLSNLVNSGIDAVYLLVQYKSQPLIEHVRKAWQFAPMFGQFITVVPPQMASGPDWFQGTADAVFQNLNLIEWHDPSEVVVFGADHIYRMDVRQMLRFHRERGADATVAAIPVPVEQGSSFGIIAVEHDGRVSAFREKPANPPPMPDDPRRAYASMGNYIFSTRALRRVLREAHASGGHDFGRDVLPHMLRTHRVYAYDFARNEVPGVKSYEEPSYWRDVGTIEAYYAASLDTLGREPRFDLFNPEWPIYSSNYHGPTTRMTTGEICNSTLGPGTIVDGAVVRDSIVRREVILEPGAQIEGCIIMDYVRIGQGARLRRAIVDRYNIIRPHDVIGFDPAADGRRFHVAAGDIVVVPLGTERKQTRSYM